MDLGLGYSKKYWSPVSMMYSKVKLLYDNTELAELRKIPENKSSMSKLFGSILFCLPIQFFLDQRVLLFKNMLNIMMMVKVE